MDYKADSTNYKKQFEIEERILQGLTKEEDILKFKKLRRTNIENISERLQSTKTREEFWQTQANGFLQRVFGIDNTVTIDNLTNMSTEDTPTPPTGAGASKFNDSSIHQTIELLAQSLHKLTTNNTNNQSGDLDLVSKPNKYHGSMDPFVIDSWIRNIDNYKIFRQWDNDETGRFAITLLRDTANVWFQNLTMQNKEPRDWLSLKREIQAYFKPENSILMFREKIRLLKQTRSITDYVHEFLKLKLGIPNMTDAEAVDKFLNGLKSNDAKIHIKDNIDMDDPVLSDAIKVAYRYEGNRQTVASSNTFNSNTFNDNTEVDDPMDLSVVIQRELYNILRGMGNSSQSNNAPQNNYQPRNQYNRRGHRGRGGYNNSNNRHQRYNDGYNRNQSNNNNHRNNIQCYSCNNYGHYARECSQNIRNQRRENINYTEQYYDNEYHRYENDHYDQTDNNQNNNDSNKPSSSQYIDVSLFYSVVPSSQSFKKPLAVDKRIIKSDIDFLINANLINTKLPLYKAIINGQTFSVLIDSGASANYCSSKIVQLAQSTRTISDQSVETANGHQSVISTIATLDIQLGDYTDMIEAYVFDTKFDIILGQSWLTQVLPIPDFFSHTWKIPLYNKKQNYTIIHPYNDKVIHQYHKNNVLSQPNVIHKLQPDPLIPLTSSEPSPHVSDVHDFLLSTNQLDRLIKKNMVSEVYLINLQDITNPIDDLAHIDASSQKLSEQDRISQEWCVEFAAKYPKVFKGKLDTLPPVRDNIDKVSKDVIVLEPGTMPTSLPPYRMSPLELKELRRQLDILINKGFISPSSSDWGSPVLFVKKASKNPDGTPELRMVCDFRALNKKTISQRIPIPRIDECLEQLQGSYFFSTLDMASGFHQIRLSPEDSQKACINTRYGKFSWKVLPFGLRNSGPRFQLLMNQILKDYVDKICIVYVDDLLIFTKSNDLEMHKKHIDMVLKRLDEAGMVVQISKCKFNQKVISFLGHEVIAGEGVRPAKKKVDAILSWPVPKNVQEVRSFIGICQYYSNYVPGFSSIAGPITDLTQGTGPKLRKVNWTPQCQQAFEILKQKIASAPILLMPDMSKPFRIECDASDYALGGVLLQQDFSDCKRWKPVAFESRKFSSAERNYPAQEREMLAIIHACRTWRCFVEGTKFEVYTDHLPLQYYNSSSKVSPRLVRWMAELETYQPTVLYKKGIENVVPDALSRKDGNTCEPNEESLEPLFLYNIHTNNIEINSNSDHPLNKIREPDPSLLTDPSQDWPIFYKKSQEEWPAKWKQQLLKEQEKFIVQDNFIWRKDANQVDKLLKFIPFSKRADLVEDFHRGFGHAGQGTVYQLMKKRVWWPRMLYDITYWLARCPECQLHSNAEKNIHHAPMKPLEVPAPFTRWHLDFIGELPATQNGNRWILMAVDYATNWIIAKPLINASGEEIVNFLYEEIVMKFSCPVEICTDRGNNFMSKILKQYMKKIKSKHIFTSAFHPRTNSKVERNNQTFKHMLTKYVKGAIHSWDEYIDTALFACRVRKHATTKNSPFYLVYGQEPRLPGDTGKPFLEPFTESDPELIEKDTLARIRDLRENRFQAEENMRQQAVKDKAKWDSLLKKQTTQVFKTGDYVLLRHESKKGLEFNWMGPYEIIGVNLDFNTYRIKEIEGKIYASWVHTDRLHPVKYDGAKVNKSWYIPRRARAIK